MMDTTKSNKLIAAVGLGTHSGRREGGPVPAPLPSSSNDGLPAALPTSAAGERAIVEGKEVRVAVTRVDWPGPASAKAKLRARSASGARKHPYAKDEGKPRSESLSRPRNPGAERAPRDGATGGSPVVSSQGTPYASASGSEGSQESLAELGPDGLPVRGGRGRPPTTGEHIGLRERREREAALKRERDREDRARKALSEDTPPPLSSKELRVYEAQCAEELGLAPTRDVAARSLEEAAAIDKIAARSGNLKGSLQRKLREAAAVVRVAAATLSERAQHMEEPGELALLRRDLKALVGKNEDLQKEVLKLGEERPVALSPP